MESSRTDTELPNKMAHLDIMEIDETSDEVSEGKPQQEFNSRVLRKRKSLTSEKNKPSNRRVNMKPLKHMVSEKANLKQIEALYLNKKVKFPSHSLETIYEEPKTVNSNTEETHIGGRKLKRLLTFQLGNQYTKEKIKKRRAKIRKLLGNKSFLNRKKIPMHEFLKTIGCSESDEVVQTTTAPPSKDMVI